MAEKRYATINVASDTYSKAIAIGKKHGIKGSWVLRALLIYFLKNRSLLKLFPTETGKKVYPLKVRKEMKEEIKAIAEELNFPIQRLVDLIFLNFEDRIDEIVENADKKEMKLPKGYKAITMIECFEKGVPWWEAASIAGSTGMYALKLWRRYKKEKNLPWRRKDVSDKKENNG